VSNVSSSSSSGGIGVLGLLGIVFVVLKLMGIITWSWWYVTMPFWGAFALVGIFIVFCFAMHCLQQFFKRKKKS